MAAEQQDLVQHIAELVDRAKISMFTKSGTPAKLVSRPMALQEVEFDGDLWFFTYDDSHKARHIARDGSVNVAFSNDKNSEWTSLSGTAEVVHDRAKAEELWSPLLKTWFEDGLDTHRDWR